MNLRRDMRRVNALDVVMVFLPALRRKRQRR
jgi:hypothetical protein